MTDEKALEVAAMVLNGAVNTQILAACRKQGLPAVGVSGVDAGLIQARKRPPVRVGEEIVDYGFVGDVVAIDPKVLNDLHGLRIRARGEPPLGRRGRHGAQHQRRHGGLSPGRGAQGARSSSS